MGLPQQLRGTRETYFPGYSRRGLKAALYLLKGEVLGGYDSLPAIMMLEERWSKSCLSIHAHSLPLRAVVTLPMGEISVYPNKSFVLEGERTMRE
jgi:hypothetical protein